MAFVIRPYHRLSAGCPVSYERLFEEGEGTVWDLSPTGLRLSGTLPLRVGDVCSLKVKLPTKMSISILAGIVRWVRGDDYGVQTLVMEKSAQVKLNAYIRDRMNTVGVMIAHNGKELLYEKELL